MAFPSPEGDTAVPVRGNLRLNDDEVIWQAVLGGLGVSMLQPLLSERTSSLAVFKQY
jgi:hypothetical protein